MNIAARIPYATLAAVAIALSVVGVPHAAYADEVTAGFTTAPVWLSRANPAAGDTVKLTTVILDTSASPVSGTVVFSVDASPVGSVRIQVDSGNSQIVSVPWTAVQGTHSVSAHVEGAIGAGTSPITLSSASTTNVQVTITAATPTTIASLVPASVTSIASSISSISPGLASSSPALVGAVAVVASTTESIRAAGVQYLTAALAPTTATSSTSKASVSAGKTAGTSAASGSLSNSDGSVLGAQIERADDSANESSDADTSSLFGGIMHGVLTFLLTIFSSAALFYPIFFLVVFFLIYLVIKRLRNPNHKRSHSKATV